MNIKFREMDTHDIPAVFEVRLSTIENAVTMEELDEDYGITPDSISESMTSRARGWVCEDSGNVVGFVMGDGIEGEVSVLAVYPQYEGKNIGATLMKFAQDWLFSKGHAELFLMTDPDRSVRAHGFYRSLGWQATGTIEDEDELFTLQQPNG